MQMPERAQSGRLLIGCCVALWAFCAVAHGQPAEFNGRIAPRYADSQEAWPVDPRPPHDAPNVVIILLDDVGYAQIGSFGGLIETPAIDRLAANGLRFSNFHTAAVCSSSRASLLTGRNPHSVGFGGHALSAMGFPGYNGKTPPSAKSVTNYLRQTGYVNYVVGKWDQTPPYEVSTAGPFDRWPSGDGFDHAYVFMGGDTHQFAPMMWNDHQPDSTPTPDHLEKSLGDRAIEWITAHHSVRPDAPFLLFYSSGTAHAPHHAPPAYIDRYRGRFDAGWDAARTHILDRQIALGIVPKDTRLSARPAVIPAWDSLPAEERRLYARQMEVFAAQLEWADAQIARVVETLARIGVLDDTLIIVTSDNGASGEAGLAGSYNESLMLNGFQTTAEENLRRLDGWGTARTYPHYHAGWAMAGNTPFRHFKQSVHPGGQQDFLVMHWPKRITTKGGIRTQFHHISDIAPTIMEAVGITMPETYNGVKQKPMEGVSMLYAARDASAPNRKQRQYFEQGGHRGIWEDGWMAVTLHAGRMPWNIDVVAPFEDDIWELYNLNEDFSGSTDLAARFPGKVAALRKAFDEEAWKYNVYPLYDDLMTRNLKQQERLYGNQKKFVYYAPGAYRIGEKVSAPVKNRSWTIDATIDLRGSEEGVIVASGGMTGGYTMFIKNNRLHFVYNFVDRAQYELESPPLEAGLNTFQFRFVKSKPFAGHAALYVNDRKVDEVEMPATHRATYSLSETFDVGRDTGTPVSRHYVGEFRFTGTLDKVEINLID
jgi:arylsulfatase A-like enzyme